MRTSSGVGAEVGAVLLAAGAGRRFGRHGEKLLAPLHDRPVVAWALEAVLGAGLASVAVVDGAVPLDELVDEVSAGRAVVVHNDNWASGQASSLRAGLDWCAERGLRAAVVGLGDQPFVGPAAWRRVAEAPEAPITTATFGGRRRPPVRLDHAVWALLPGRGDEGARALMRRRPELVAEVRCKGDPLDVDTPDDLASAQEVAGQAR